MTLFSRNRQFAAITATLPGFSGFSFILLLAGLILIVNSCAPTEELKDDEMEQLLDEAAEEYSDLARQLDEMAILEEEMDESAIEEMEALAEELLAELPELDVNLQGYRSSFADQQAVTHNEIPEVYFEIEEEERQRDRNRGFRIQIISTQDARLAEDIREDFEEWINSVSEPPHAQSYMIFQQPYYRVHVGDFLDRDKAMEFTEFVRLRYPDAWVVHSRINPGRVQQ